MGMVPRTTRCWGILAAVVLSTSACSELVVIESPRSLVDPTPECTVPAEITPEDLESYPGCDLYGTLVLVGGTGGTGGAVVPDAGSSVSSEAILEDGTLLEFTLTNTGQDGVLLEVTGSPGDTQTWGPESARDAG